MFLHVAFLRGVGGPKPASGDELRRSFAGAGYDPVVPVIATGNVVFGLGRNRKVPAPATFSSTGWGRIYSSPSTPTASRRRGSWRSSTGRF